MKLKYLTMSAMFSAIIFVTTFAVKIPLSVAGYVHLGDTFILLACAFMPMPYAIVSAGIGSALADIAGGYIAYAPATLVIKCLMAVVFALFFKLGKNWANIVGGILAVITMAAGYFVYETFLYGITVAALNILFNLMPGAVCMIIAEPTAYALKRWWYRDISKNKKYIAASRR